MSLTFLDRDGTYNYTSSSVRFAALDGDRPVIYAVTRAALAKAEGVPILVPGDCLRAAPGHRAQIRAVAGRKFDAGLINPDGIVMVEVGDIELPDCSER
jgi:hypothetical protein